MLTPLARYGGGNFPNKNIANSVNSIFRFSIQNNILIGAKARFPCFSIFSALKGGVTDNNIKSIKAADTAQFQKSGIIDITLYFKGLSLQLNL
jgi:hypothetical protein